MFQNGLKREVSPVTPRVIKAPKPPQSFHLGKGYGALGSPFRRRPLKKKVQSPFDQLAQEGYDRQVVFDGDDSPAQNSLLYLSPSGPSMPVVHKLRQDLGEMMTFMINGPVREMTHSFQHNRTPVMARVSNALQKMMGGHMGDRTFDAFDWVPLVAILVATGLILSGLFPSGFGITNGNVILGRRGGRAEGQESNILDEALSKC